ncbi:MBL fold metallo-hydrolase [bacterium]|nr:MBL fold metallo-hydrolase [bacterium]
MRIKYYGPRGSLPTPGKNTLHYGGNTTCLSIRANNTQFIVDGGSGLRVLGNELFGKQKKGEYFFFWTHFHWDHIMGFPFFVPNFIPGNKMNHYGSYQMKNVLLRQQEFITFPVAFKQMPSDHTFHTVLKNKSIQVRGVTIDNCPNNHPAGGYIYKFTWKNKSVVFATDTEHFEKGMDQKLLKLSQGADLLIYDAQYTPEEYVKGRQGWGHSTWEQGVALAKAAKVKRLHLYHHDQLHTDGFLEKKILAPARKQFAKTHLAREGWEIKL